MFIGYLHPKIPEMHNLEMLLLIPNNMSQYDVGVELLLVKRKTFSHSMYLQLTLCEYTVLEWYEIITEINLKPQEHNVFHCLYLKCFSSYQIMLEINLWMDWPFLRGFLAYRHCRYIGILKVLFKPLFFHFCSIKRAKEPQLSIDNSRILLHMSSTLS